MRSLLHSLANTQQRHAHESPVIFYSLVIGFVGTFIRLNWIGRGVDERGGRDEEELTPRPRHRVRRPAHPQVDGLEAD